MNVIVNGHPKELPSASTVAMLLELLQLEPTQVAVERNLDIIPRDAFAATVLHDGDRVEVVRFVGGG
ncbi:MAG: sulfur carrier protein ThiS [Syntrophotaleaceae bacterium]